MEIGVSTVAWFGQAEVLARRIEQLGFASLLFTDSQNLCPEVWSQLTLAARASERSCWPGRHQLGDARSRADRVRGRDAPVDEPAARCCASAAATPRCSASAGASSRWRSSRPT